MSDAGCVMPRQDPAFGISNFQFLIPNSRARYTGWGGGVEQRSPGAGFRAGWRLWGRVRSGILGSVRRIELLRADVVAIRAGNPLILAAHGFQHFPCAVEWSVHLVPGEGVRAGAAHRQACILECTCSVFFVEGPPDVLLRSLRLTPTMCAGNVRGILAAETVHQYHAITNGRYPQGGAPHDVLPCCRLIPYTSVALSAYRGSVQPSTWRNTS